MYVDDLSLTDFRSYGSVTVDLEPGVTVFVGRNGQGKTNLAEALGYVATLGALRVATDAPLVRRGAARAVVRATVVHESRRLLVELEIAPGAANRARLGGAPVGRPRDVLGALRTVLFAPEDLALVKGDPAERRRFLDELLTQRTPRMAGVKADVERVLKQRNALLKSARSTRGHSGDEHVTSTLDVWDEQLSRLGAELLAERVATLDALAPRMAAAYATVAPEGGDAVVEYRASWCVDDPPRDRSEIAERLAAALVEARRDELERGLTLVGPHRDDLVLTLGGLPAKGYASHGESWSLALAMRLASFDLLRSDDRPGGDPVLVLDDVFAELDQARRERLALAVADAEQVLVTAAVDDDVPASLHGRRFRVADGTVVAE